MARGLAASTTTAVGATATQPYYLVRLGFSTPAYLSSTQQITWSSQNWLATSMQVQMSDTPELKIFNEGTSLGQTVLSDGVAGKTVDIYIGYANDSAHPNPVHVFSGEMGETTITEVVSIRCKRFPPLKTPRHFAISPHCNHLPRNGTRINTPKGVITLGAL